MIFCPTFWACAPHSINTRGCSKSFKNSSKCSENSIQPRPAWLAGLPRSTLHDVFISNTPRFAHSSKKPLLGISHPKSSCSSLKIFCKLGGTGTPGRTEKHMPCACPGPWYGSCPMITTFVVSSGHWAKHENISGLSGYTSLTLRSASTRFISRRKYDCLASCSTNWRQEEKVIPPV